MILPPFLGIASKYDEKQIREAILTYLNFDVATFTDPSTQASVTFLTPDVATFDSPHDTASHTYVAADVASFSRGSIEAGLSYLAMDVCMFDPPPTVPDITLFLATGIEDARIDFTWSTPNANRSPLLGYVLEYSDCFLSNILTENNDTLIAQPNNLMTQNNNEITTENSNHLVFENASLITENHESTCHYQSYDYRRLLIEDFNRVLGNDSFLVSENSSGIGLINSVNVDPLENGQAYIFRVAAFNAVGLGEYGYSTIVTPVGPLPLQYCDIKLFMQPNATTNIYASLVDYSCRQKDINYYGNVATTTDAKFGAASLDFSGDYSSSPTPATYSHVQVNNNSGTTGDDWSLYGDFTIEMWIKPDASSDGTQYLMSAHNQETASEEESYEPDYSYYAYEWQLYRSNSKLRFQTYARSGFYEEEGNEGVFYPFIVYNEFETPDLNLSTTEFSHVAVSRFNGQIRIFVNGQQQAKDEMPWDVPISGDYLIIGAEQRRHYQRSDEFNTGRGEAFNPFKGKIDDIMISTKARYARDFVPEKYSEPADCGHCGGYSAAASAVSVSDHFIP